MCVSVYVRVCVCVCVCVCVWACVCVYCLSVMYICNVCTICCHWVATLLTCIIPTKYIKIADVPFSDMAFLSCSPDGTNP